MEMLETVIQKNEDLEKKLGKKSGRVTIAPLSSTKKVSSG
jgi:hypothetical protein